jgi:hypothetical protein
MFDPPGHNQRSLPYLDEAGTLLIRWHIHDFPLKVYASLHLGRPEYLVSFSWEARYRP